MTEIVLAFPGTAVRKSGIREKLGSQPGVEVRDVDKILCSLQATRDRLEASGAYHFRDPVITPRLIDVIQLLPRTDVLELWATALREAAAALFTTDAAVRVLMTGIMYHSNRRSEFYSPFDLRILTAELNERSLTVGRVVMFVDDLYDLYGRLSGAGEIYDRVKSVEAEYGRLKDEDGLDPSVLSAAEHVLIATEVQVSQLITLLHWRQMEVTQAERIAESLQVQYLLWAMKHNVSGLVPWLRGDARAVVYVSHPISRPRRELIEKGDWPAFVPECNAVQSELAALGVTAVMPAAIDEYRLGKEASDGTARPRRRPVLTTRWPLIPGDRLYSNDVPGAPDHLDILTPVMMQGEALVPAPADWGNLDLLHDPLRSLERQIGVQVAARDHTLVVHSNHIVVFRPFFGKPHISGGVRAEIDHWSTLAQKEGKRRIVFLHRLADVRAVLNEEELDSVLRGAREELVGEMLCVDITRARRVIHENGRSVDLLDGGVTTSRERAVIRKATEAAPRRALWKILAKYNVEIHGVPEAQVGVWVIRDESPWATIWPAVLAFLEGAPVPLEAYSEGLALIPTISDD